MEQLKSLSEVCQPDIRYRGRVDLDKTTRMISETTIETTYSVIQPITFGSTVPDEIRNHFERAFAWVEMALRMKSGDKKTSFKSLLDKAFNNRKLTSGIGPPVGLSVAL